MTPMVIFLWRFEDWRLSKQAVTSGCFEADFWWGNPKIDRIPTIIYRICSEVVSGRDTIHPRQSKQGSICFCPKLLRNVFPKELVPRSTFHFIYITSPTSFMPSKSISSPSPPTSLLHPLHHLYTSSTSISSTSHASSTSSTSTSTNFIYITYIIYINFIYRCSTSTCLLQNSHNVICNCTGVVTQGFLQFLHRSCFTGVVIQEFSHRS